MLINKDVTELVAPFCLIHVVNNKNVMNAGVAKVISRKWPQVKEDYHAYFAIHSNTSLLGQIIMTHVGEGQYILSMIAQDGYGNDGKRYLQYDALEQCLAQAKRISTQLNIPLYAPFKMGCGLAGGNWELVLPMLNESNVTICKVGE